MHKPSYASLPMCVQNVLEDRLLQVSVVGVERKFPSSIDILGPFIIPPYIVKPR